MAGARAIMDLCLKFAEGLLLELGGMHLQLVYSMSDLDSQRRDYLG